MEFKERRQFLNGILMVVDLVTEILQKFSWEQVALFTSSSYADKKVSYRQGQPQALSGKEQYGNTGTNQAK